MEYFHSDGNADLGQRERGRPGCMYEGIHGGLGKARERNQPGADEAGSGVGAGVRSATKTDGTGEGGSCLAAVRRFGLREVESGNLFLERGGNRLRSARSSAKPPDKSRSQMLQKSHCSDRATRWRAESFVCQTCTTRSNFRKPACRRVTTATPHALAADLHFLRQRRRIFDVVVIG